MRIVVRWPCGMTIADSWRTLRDLGSFALVSLLMAGCASLSSAPPPMTAEAECLRNNGAWRQVLNYCEHGR